MNLLAGWKHNFFDAHRLYAQWEQTHLKKVFDRFDVDCVFDIGANQGQYAEMLRRRVGYKGWIFSFEPNPRDAAILRQRARNDSKWTVSEIAISDQDGSATFNVMRASQFSSLSAPSQADTKLFEQMNRVEKVVTVQTWTLSTALSRLRLQQNFSRPFLKMDTQGYDVNIVRGSPQAVREFIGLQSELSVAKLYADAMDFRQAITEYERHGFTLSAFVPNNSGHFPRLIETDCIMVRSDLVG
ncbi:FkbM family methyltransferase [Pandoraea anapnoica]|nr:FkbM family methyltransferase [Pandoraea anapnoica]